MARMAFVAVRPSITGIIMSMRMASKVPAGWVRKASTASCPSLTMVSVAPSSEREMRTISALSSLSSASSRCRPRRLAVGSGGGGAATACSETAKGSVMTKVEPTPSVLLISMVPCIFSTRFWTMVMPRPVPFRSATFSWEKGSKICSRNASLMPMPVSEMVQR